MKQIELTEEDVKILNTLLKVELQKIRDNNPTYPTMKEKDVQSLLIKVQA
jgi:hypothetical protein